MLQLFGIEQFPFDHMIPCDREALLYHIVNGTLPSRVRPAQKQCLSKSNLRHLLSVPIEVISDRLPEVIWQVRVTMLNDL
jgi:hypothetical protein